MAPAHRHLLASGWASTTCVNAHPRVDSYTERLGFRRKAWIEFAGCLVFALPYTAVLLWYGWDFVRIAWEFNESSDAALGLPYRWIIKGIMYAGLLAAAPRHRQRAAAPDRVPVLQAGR